MNRECSPRQIPDIKNERVILTNIGTVYQDLGQYDKAQDNYQQALAIARQVHDIKGEGIELTKIGHVYMDVDQYQKALEICKQALTIARQVKDPNSEGDNLTNIGTAYGDLGQYEKALQSLQLALEVYEQAGDTESAGAALGQIGTVYVKLGKYEEALEVISRQTLVSRTEWNRKFSAEVYIVEEVPKLGLYDMDLENDQQALAIARQIKAPRTGALVLNNWGYVLLASGEAGKAEKQITASIGVFEAIREKVHGDKERTGFQGSMPDVYGFLAAARLALGKPENAFEAIERGRAKSFLELLGARQTATRRGGEKSRQLFQMENELSGLRKERLLVASVPAGEKTRAAAMDQKISEVDKRRMDLIDQIRLTDPELGSLAAVDPPSLKGIQALLPAGTLLVEYFHNGKYVASKQTIEKLWIFLIHKDGFEFKKVSVSQSDLINTLDRYAALLSDSGSKRQDLDSAASKLYGWLIEPIEATVRKLQAKTVVVVPWGPMFKVPFASLAPRGGEPLCARQNMVVAPSAGVYRYVVKKRGSGHENILALGNPSTALSPLPGAEREVKEIASLFKKSSVQTGAQATEKLLKDDYSKLGRPDVIHLACHGIFNDKVPELSYLALTPDHENDGKLEMHELFDLDWKGVSLVTLSACSSGKGKLGAGNDLVGMVRGLMFAGAPSVLSSLWDVDDEATRALMVNFYKNYVGGMSKPESLKNAQLAMMKNPKWSHPYYWSGFVLFGDWE